MALNRKLTPVLAGRTVQSVSQENNMLWITFADGSVMKVKTSAGGSNEAITGRAVNRVRQAGNTMNIDFADGTSLAVALAEPTSSVMLRDKNGVMEYAD